MGKYSSRHYPRETQAIPYPLTGGINLGKSADQIAENELVVAKNCSYPVGSDLPQTRFGFTQWTTGAGTGEPIEAMFDYVRSSTERYTCAVSDGQLWYLDNARAFQSIGAIDGSEMPHGVTFNQNLLVAAGSTLNRWDGTTLDTVADAPHGTGLLEQHNRLWGIGATGAPDRAVRCNIQDETDWTVDADPVQAQYVDVAWKNGGQVNGIIDYKGKVLVSKTGHNPGIWVLDTTASYTDWQVEQLSPKAAFVNQRSVVSLKDDVYWISPHNTIESATGVYQYGDIGVSPVGRPVNVALKVIANQAHAAYNPLGDQIWFSTGFHGVIWVYHVTDKKWTWWLLANDLRAYSYCYIPSLNKMLMGADDGHIYFHDHTSFQDAATDYASAVRTRLEKPAYRGHRYLIQDVQFFYQGLHGGSTDAGSLNVWTDSGKTKTAAATFTPQYGWEETDLASGDTVDADGELAVGESFDVYNDRRVDCEDYQLEVEIASGAIRFNDLGARVSVIQRRAA